MPTDGSARTLVGLLTTLGAELAPPPTPAQLGPAVPPVLGRYVVTDELGRGGMGRVLAAHDPEIGREVAIKVVVGTEHVPPDALERFIVEARITGQLEHPNIVPVYDVGLTDDGHPYIVMKRVRGEPLARRLADPPDRLLAVFVDVCDAVACAHDRGVLHGDLKPENVMLGEFGEVMVVDWGLARLWSTARRRAVAVDAATPSRELSGTPGYIAPELLRLPAASPHPSADQWALGALLYTMLTGSPPYTNGTTMEVLQATLAGPPEDVRLRDLDREVPDAIAAICMRALAHDPADRFPDVAALAAAVREDLAGTRRRERALAMVADADLLRPRVDEQRARALELRARAEATLAAVKPSDSIDTKEPAWKLQDEADALERAAGLDAVMWEQGLRAALNLVPDLHAAHRRLATHYRAQVEAAELARDHDRALSAEWLLRQHDRGHHRAFLKGTASLTLVTDPPGAEVFIAPIAARGRRLQPGAERSLGTTPLVDVDLKPGSYRCRVVAPGRRPVIYPVHLARAGSWDGVPPGGSEPHAIWLPPDGSLGVGDRYVPAGWATLGGDERAPDPLSLRRVWVDAFVARAFPVTFREVLAFLNGLRERGEAEAAERWQPRARAHPRHPLDGDPLVARDAQGAFVPPPDATADWLDRPATQLDLASCIALAEAAPGGPWRLPDELEWEKAARGVDGRHFPWGDTFDPAFCNSLSSRTPPLPAPVTDFPHDMSVYGVRGLGGNIRDRCGNRWLKDGSAQDGGRLVVRPADPATVDFVSSRGGAFSNAPHLCRAAGRYGDGPSARLITVGLRLVRTA